MTQPQPSDVRLELILANAIRPALASLANAHRIPHSTAAERMLLAVGWQESRFVWRDQVDIGPAVMGPATGFWQFERAGGIQGVMHHHATRAAALNAVAAANLPFEAPIIWAAFTDPKYDRLAATFARLLLWSDPRPLPETFTQGWDYYVRNWRPGRPHPSTWAFAWNHAHETVRLVSRESASA